MCCPFLFSKLLFSVSCSQGNAGARATMADLELLLLQIELIKEEFITTDRSPIAFLKDKKRNTALNMFYLF